MKKNITLICLIAAAFVAFHANASLWLIGGLSPDGWVTNKGVQFEQIDESNYSLEVYVTATGQQYYSLTTQLASGADDWDAIRPYRFGGNMQVNLDTPTQLEEGTDASPYTNISTVGTYVLNFNISTRTLTVSLKQNDTGGDFNGTIYVSKSSVGNIWAWDDGGNYFDQWPGKAINTLETVTVAGNDYYKFAYDHNTTNPGLIFNLNGSPQTPNLIPENGKLYTYNGGYTVEISNMPSEEVGAMRVRGTFNDWGLTNMNLGYDGKWTISLAMEAGAEFKFFNADEQWIGAESEGNFIVTQEQVEQGTPLTLIEDGGMNFQIPVAGEWTLTVDPETMTLVISGIWSQDGGNTTHVYILGNVGTQEWAPNEGVEMEEQGDNVFVYTAQFMPSSYFSFTTKLASSASDWGSIKAYRFGATSDGYNIDNEMNTDITLGEMGDSSDNAFLTQEGGEITITVDLNRNVVVFSADGHGVESVTLNVTDADEIMLEPFATLQLVATVLPEQALNKDVVWTSSDEDIAVVNADGLVTAQKIPDLIRSEIISVPDPGEDHYVLPVTITATSVDNPDATASVTLYVKGDKVSAISTVATHNAVSVKYLNAKGQVSSAPFKGFNIKVVTCDDGSCTMEKVLK